MPTIALTGARIFTGDRFLDAHAVLLDAETIAGTVPIAEIPAELLRETLPGGVLAPGFVDVQVNGGGGVLFNATPDVAAIAHIAATHARFGTTALLPTFITDRPQRMHAAIAAARAAIAANTPGVVGLHLEGPFIAVARKGAHDPALIRPLTDADVDLLCDTGIAPLLITVAAENASARQIRKLADAGVIVSIGHSDASYEVAMAAAEAGARGVTHIYNAMSQLGHRAPRPGRRGARPRRALGRHDRRRRARTSGCARRGAARQAWPRKTRAYHGRNATCRRCRRHVRAEWPHRHAPRRRADARRRHACGFGF